MADVERSGITIEELLAAFARLQADDADGGVGWTKREIADATGMTTSQVQRRLEAAAATGTLRCGKRSKRNRFGDRQLVHCYWIEQSAPVAKAKKR